MGQKLMVEHITMRDLQSPRPTGMGCFPVTKRLGGGADSSRHAVYALLYLSVLTCLGLSVSEYGGRIGGENRQRIIT